MTKSRERGRSEMKEREEKRRGGGKRTTFSTSSLSRLSEFSSSSALPVFASSPWLSQLWTFGTQLISCHAKKDRKTSFCYSRANEWLRSPSPILLRISHFFFLATRRYEYTINYWFDRSFPKFLLIFSSIHTMSNQIKGSFSRTQNQRVFMFFNSSVI